MRFNVLIRSIRGQLLVLVIVAVLPALLVIYLGGAHGRKEALQAARDNQLQLVQAIAFQHQAQVDGLRQLLATLALLPEVQRLDEPACTDVLKKIVRMNPGIQNIILIDINGRVIATGTPIPPVRMTVGERKYYRDAIRSGRFSVGEYVISKSTSLPTLHFSLPVRQGETGRIVGVVAASLNMRAFKQFCLQLNLSDENVLNLSDHRGVRMYRFPESRDSALGMPDRPEMLKKVNGPEEEGTFFAKDRYGVERLMAFKKLRLYSDEPPYLLIRLTLPRETVMKTVNEDSRNTFLLLLLTSFLALVSAWFLGNRIIGRKLKRLAASTHLLGLGALNIRTGIRHEGGEIEQLASSFDDMAKQLELLVSERDDLVSEYRSILKTSLDGFFVCDTRGRFLDVNDAYCQMTGYGRDELLEMGIHELEEEHENHGGAIRTMEHLMAERSVSFETRHRCKDGQIKDLEISALYLDTGSGKLISFVRDITLRKRSERELNELALTDELTGLTNRRGFILLASQQIKISFRTETSIVLVYADVDEMKAINDTFGHAMGDRALMDVATILRNSVRSSDIVARLGGDEFVILSIESGEQDDNHILSRLEEHLAAHNRETDAPYTLSISFGLTVFDAEHPCTIEQLLERGDSSMYEQKQTRKRERTA